MWIIPTVINLDSGIVESDLIQFDSLVVKLFFLTAIVFFAQFFVSSFEEKDFYNFIFYISLFFAPMVLIIIIDSAYLSILCNFCRVYSYDNEPFFTSELLCLFIILFLVQKNQFIKWFLIGLGFLGLFFIQGRAAILASLIPMFIYLFNNSIKNYKKEVFFFIIFSILFFAFFFHEFIFNFFFNNPFWQRFEGNLQTLSNRIFMYELAVDSIIKHPLIGIGFGVTPEYYSFTDHKAATIHNFFLRIATENGLPITIIIIGIFFMTLIKIIRNKNYYELYFFISFLIYNSFSTRHLSLNLMNVLFYIIVIKVLMTKPRQQIKAK